MAKNQHQINHHKRKRNNKSSNILSLVIIVVIFAIIGSFIALKAINEKRSKTTINGITMTLPVSEELVMHESLYHYICPDEEYDFGIQIKYTDANGKVVYSEPSDKTKIHMIFSDTSICDRPTYNTMIVHWDCEAGTTFTVKTIYETQGKTQEITNTFFVCINSVSTLGEDGYVTNPSCITCLVGYDRPVSYDYEPSDLVEPDINFADDVAYKNRKIRKEVSNALARMFMAAKNEGIILIARTCYTTDATHGWEHKLGLAIDLSGGSTEYNGKSFGGSKEYKWLEKNAYKYGFIVRYEEDKTDITGMKAIPTHFRYVGIELATYLYNNSMTLDEMTIESMKGL